MTSLIATSLSFAASSAAQLAPPTDVDSAVVGQDRKDGNEKSPAVDDVQVSASPAGATRVRPLMPESLCDFLKEIADLNAEKIDGMRKSHREETAELHKKLRTLGRTIQDYDDQLSYVVCVDDKRMTLQSILDGIGTDSSVVLWKVCSSCRDANCDANSGEQGAGCKWKAVAR